MTAHKLTIPTKGFAMPAELLAPNAAESANGSAGAAGGQTVPAVVVIHDIYGTDDVTRAAAQRLAGLGFITLSPDFFAESGGPRATDETALMDFSMSLPDARLVNDVLTAVNLLAGRPEVDSSRLGVVGWGWGGAYALMAAAHDARIRAAADIGGDITYPVLTPQRPGSPLNFVASIEGALFAAYPEHDPLHPGSEVERLEEQLREHDRRGAVKRYPGAPSRFWRDDSLPQTQALWRRLENFLIDNLLGPAGEDEPIGDYPNEASRLHA